MNLHKFGRVIVSALFLVIFSWGAVFAHALPGSFISLWQEDKQLNIQISVPLEDLMVAAPSLAALEALSIDQKIAPDDEVHLADYFAAHFSLMRDEVEVPISFEGVSLRQGYNEHVGTFMWVDVAMVGALPEQADVLPLGLRYDAVMHEVRNHRTAVFWGAPDTNQIGLAEFGYKQAEGQSRVIILNRPEQ